MTYPTGVRWSSAAASGQPHGSYRFRGDVNYGDVVEVMRILHEANITRMALVTEAE
jgi:biopolymer transport protein ExbD